MYGGYQLIQIHSSVLAGYHKNQKGMAFNPLFFCGWNKSNYGFALKEDR